MPSPRACSSVATEVATQRIPLEAAARDRRQQVGDSRPGAEPNRHPVLDQLRGRLRGKALLGVGVRHGAPLYPCTSSADFVFMRTYGLITTKSAAETYARDEMDARIWLTGPGGEPHSVALSAERVVVGRDPEAAFTSTTRRSPGTTWRSRAAAGC